MFNECEGITCSFCEGAMYSFPRIRLPQGAIDAATVGSGRRRRAAAGRRG